MEHREEVREFLTSRRAKITPEQTGLPIGTGRRAPGLRRAEVAILRTEAGRDPHDKGLQDLIGELSTRSEEFRTRWAARNVRIHGSGTKRFHHATVGDLELQFEELELTTEPGLALVIYSAEPASPSEERLRLLASWAATVDLSDDASRESAR